MNRKLKGTGRPYAKSVHAYMAGYMSGESLGAIAKRLGTTENALLVTASELRRRGVRLPKVRERFDTESLNKIVRRYRASTRRRPSALPERAAS